MAKMKKKAWICRNSHMGRPWKNRTLTIGALCLFLAGEPLFAFDMFCSYSLIISRLIASSSFESFMPQNGSYR